MKYKGWLILTIVLGIIYPPIWVLSIIIAAIGYYTDKNNIKKTNKSINQTQKVVVNVNVHKKKHKKKQKRR